MKETRRSVSSLAAVIVAIALCACSGLSVKGTWAEGAARNKSYSRILVIGVSPDRDVRCAFEATFASQLASAATTAISSCSKMGVKEPLTREDVERVAASVEADAVLATRLISSATGYGQGNSNDMRGQSVYKPTDFGFDVYGMPVTYVDFQTDAPLDSLKRSLHVLTKLYDTQGATLVYSIDTVTKSQEIDSTEAMLTSITGPTADRLRHAGLIR